jgi:hypothetical protein
MYTFTKQTANKTEMSVTVDPIILAPEEDPIILALKKTQ